MKIFTSLLAIFALFAFCGAGKKLSIDFSIFLKKIYA
jgi:hypothetical protein